MAGVCARWHAIILALSLFLVARYKWRDRGRDQVNIGMTGFGIIGSYGIRTFTMAWEILNFSPWRPLVAQPQIGWSAPH